MTTAAPAPSPSLHGGAQPCLLPPHHPHPRPMNRSLMPLPLGCFLTSCGETNQPGREETGSHERKATKSGRLPVLSWSHSGALGAPELGSFLSCAPSPQGSSIR